MTLTRSHRLTLIAGVGALALTLIAPLSANAATTTANDTLQAQIDAVLTEHPGGTQTAPNEITWDDGAVVLTLEVPGGAFSPLAVGSCATDYYCAYSNYNLSGSKVSFYECDTTKSTSLLSTVRSVANARSSGYVQAKSSAGSVLATIGYNGSLAYAPTGITQLTCVS